MCEAENFLRSLHVNNVFGCMAEVTLIVMLMKCTCTQGFASIDLRLKRCRQLGCLLGLPLFVTGKILGIVLSLGCVALTANLFDCSR